MYKFVVLYYRVDDEDSLEQFYIHTHLPLLEQLPGLRKLEVSRVAGQPTGQSRFHLMIEAYFDNKQAMRVAQISEPGRQVMDALRTWAEARLIVWFYANAFEEEKGDR